MDRPIEEIEAGMDEASSDAPFMLSRAELIAHLEAKGATGCGGYSTIEKTDGRRDVAWDYACKD